MGMVMAAYKLAYNVIKPTSRQIHKLGKTIKLVMIDKAECYKIRY